MGVRAAGMEAKGRKRIGLIQADLDAGVVIEWY